MRHAKCSKCDQEKPRSDFYLTARGWLAPPCKECRIAAAAKYAADNKETVRNAQRKWRNKNSEAIKAYKKQWNNDNKERLSSPSRAAAARLKSSLYVARCKKEGRLLWYQKNPTKHLAATRARQAGIKTASVKWRNNFYIEEAYDLARRRTRATGFAWHVDHIVPLKSKLVCGLHCEQNIRVVPSGENIRKSNTTWPGMP